MFNFFKKKTSTSKTFCILPWIHFYANPDGTVLPCCIGDHNHPLGNVRNDSVIDIWSNDKFKSMRANMLAGNKCNECSACYNNEDNNVKSFRQSVNEDYKEYIDNALKEGISPSVNLKYLDIRWSNICNLKCRSCSSTYSSSWAKEDKKKEVFIFAGGDNNDKLYNQLLPYFSGLKEIYFAGGEPLLMEKHYEILDYLIATGNTNIKLRYNTNLTNLHFKKKPVTEYWKQFKNVNVFASLDSWGPRAEYIRDGTDWNTVEQNIKAIKQQTPHVNLTMSTVVSVFNISTLPEFVDYLLDNNLYDKKNFEPYYYNLINPSYYSVNVLTDEQRDLIKEKLLSSNHDFSNVISYLENAVYDPALRVKFEQVTTHYDNIRNQSFSTTFPELL